MRSCVGLLVRIFTNNCGIMEGIQHVLASHFSIHSYVLKYIDSLRIHSHVPAYQWRK